MLWQNMIFRYATMCNLKKNHFFCSFSDSLNLNDDQSVIESVQNMLQPDIERRLAAKKRLDDLAVSTLLENVTLLQSNLPSESENLCQEPQPSSSSSSK